MPNKKDIKIILRKNKSKPPKKERIKISNPIDFKSFIPLLIILIIVIFSGYKIIFHLRKDKEPSVASIIELGKKDLENSNVDEAIKKFEEVLKKDSNNKDALYNLAVTKYIKGQYDEAISDLEKISKRDPKDVDSLNTMGNIFRDKREYDKAIGKYRDAIQVDPNFVQAYIGISDVMSIMGNEKGAREIIDEGLLRNPGNERLLVFKEAYAEKK